MKKRERYITLPGDWDELTPEDWREALRLRQAAIDRGLHVTLTDVRTETARLMLKNRGVRTQLGNDNYIRLVGQIADTLTWLWQERDGGIALVLGTSRQLLPRVQYGTGKEHTELLGPRDCGADMTFGEFRQAVAHMKAYENPAGETGDDRAAYRETALSALAGLLYRPAATDRQRELYGDREMVRQPYDWDGIDEKTRRGRRMKPWQRWGAYAWMECLCEQLATETFVIDGEDYCFSPLFNPHPGEKAGGGHAGLAQVCHTLAESHVFGTARDVDRTRLLTVLQKLLADYESLERMKRRQGNHNS